MIWTTVLDMNQQDLQDLQSIFKLRKYYRVKTFPEILMLKGVKFVLRGRLLCFDN